jgi:uncharacterized RmlC-like cupin family protein
MPGFLNLFRGNRKAPDSQLPADGLRVRVAVETGQEIEDTAAAAGLPAAVAAEGIAARHQLMDNGERRFRLLAGDGSAYIRTVAGPAGSWQNSHYHDGVRETYIVQRGWAVLMWFVDAKPAWRVLRPGDVHTVDPGVPHNLYLPAGAATHTVKHGTGDPADRHHSVELDLAIESLSATDIVILR